MPDFVNLNSLMLIFLILGVILVILEMIMPGFGLAGLLGLISLIAGIFIAAKVVSPTLLIVIIAFVLVFIAIALLWIYKSATKGGKVSKLLLLHTKTTKEDGFSSTAPYDYLEGKEGTSVTKLRPTGIAEIDGSRYDVVSDGEFISEGTPLKVTKVEGFRIVVKKI